DGPVAEALRADLASPDVERRTASAYRAGREGGARCIEPLAGALADAEPRVRTAAAQALALLAQRAQEHGDPPPADLARAEDAPAARLEDRRAEVAAEAAFLLAERGDRRALPVLTRTLGHRDLGFEAARLLGVLGDPAGQGPLRATAQRFFGDPLVKLCAAA